jgi:hypothetical protein
MRSGWSSPTIGVSLTPIPSLLVITRLRARRWEAEPRNLERNRDALHGIDETRIRARVLERVVL